MVTNGMIVEKSEQKVTPRQWLWAVAELLVVAALVLGANIFDVVPVSETPWLVVLGWLSLRLRGLTWRTLGLRRPDNWVVTIGIAVGSAVALQLLSEFVIEPITGRPDLSDFQSVVGNLPAALVLLVIVWVLAAFGEEMAYRGYVLERAATLGNHSPVAYTSAVVVVSLLFGLGHFYQGLTGVIGSSISGLLFGMLYLKGKRNLWLPIFAHGFSDTIGLVLIYLGFAPGL